MRKNDIISKFYNDVDNGLVGVSELKTRLGKQGLYFTEKEIREGLSGNESYTLNKPIIKNIERRKYYVPDVDNQWQIDLTFLNLDKSNDGIKGVLTCIDLFSRYAWVRPIKSKTGKEIADHLDNIFKEGRKPDKLQVDKGSEFYNKDVKALLKKYNIDMFSISSDTKSAFIESFNKNLKRRMTRLFDAQQNFRYIDNLQKLVMNYNRTKHSSIKMTPIAASQKKNYIDAYLNQYGEDEFIPAKKPKYKVGDYVRVPSDKTIFSKESTGNWTIEIFIIQKVNLTNPITYEIKNQLDENIDGIYYESEIQKVSKPENFRVEKVMKSRTIKGKKEHLVRWLGYSEKFDTWIPDKDLKDIQK